MSSRQCLGRGLARIAVLSVLVTSGFVPSALAQSTWKSGTHGAWLNNANWTGGIPQLPGDVATLTWSPQQFITVDVAGPVTLGQLTITSPSQFTVVGAGLLQFDRPGDLSAVLQVTGLQRTHRIGTQIAILDSQGLTASVAAGSTLTFDSGIASANGNLIKQGTGILELGGPSLTWGGSLSIEAGEVRVNNSFALGSDIGSTQIKSGATLTVARGLTLFEPLQMSGGVLRRGGTTDAEVGGTVTINGPIELLSTSQISSMLHLTNAMTVAGQISGPGGLNLSTMPGAANGLTVSGNNSYLGLTTIGSGRVVVAHANALGSASQGTVIAGNAQLVVQQTVAEPITISNGTLNLSAPVSATGPISFANGTLMMPENGTFSSPITLSSASGVATIEGRGATFSGGTSGPGSVRIRQNWQVNGAPLSHQGKITIGTTAAEPQPLVVFSTPNTYKGKTEMLGGTLIVQHVDALGAADSLVEITGGTVQLDAVPQRDYLVIGGTLKNLNSSQPLVHDVRVQSGAISGVGVYEGRIILEPTASTAPWIRGGTFNGEITGVGRVSFGGNNDDPGNGHVSLNANNSFTGIARVVGSVDANSPQALGTVDRGTVVAGDGHLSLHAPTSEPIAVGARGRVDVNQTVARLPYMFNASPSLPPSGQSPRVTINTPSNFAQHYNLDVGTLEVNQPTTIDSLAIRSNGQLNTSGAGVISTSRPLELQSGIIDASISGAPSIRKTTSERAILRDLHQYAGPIHIEKGTLLLDSTSPYRTVPGSLHVAADNAVLQTLGNQTIQDDVFLANATGMYQSGGLFMVRSSSGGTNRVQLHGQLDLGATGSIIGASNSEGTAGDVVLETHGPITGGALTVRGYYATVEIHSDQNIYTGATHVYEGVVRLSGEGRLSTTSEIILNGDSRTPRGMLYIDNRTDLRSDRVADHIPIQMRGGELAFYPSTSSATTETLGKVTLASGASTIHFGSSSTYQSPLTHQLELTQIDRELGAIAIVEMSNSAQVHVATPPALVGGLVPWLIAVDHKSSSNRDTNFATITDRGLAPITNLQSNIHAAAPTDNVRVATSTALTGDLTVNSISFADSQTLNLGGHRLTLETGGAILTRSGIAGGQLTAGALGGHELILHNGYVSANIVDNGTNPVHVTIYGASTAGLSGVNTYTGDTHIVGGNVQIENQLSLPAGGNVTVNGGELRLMYTSTGPHHLGTIHLTGDGRIQQQSGNSLISFDQMVIDNGVFAPGRIGGNGKIIKQSIGSAEFGLGTQTAGYTGEVVVEDGLLTVYKLEQAKVRVNGGTLYFREAAANEINLAGGAVEYSRLSGKLNVSARSQLSIDPFGSASAEVTGPLTGAGTLVFDNRSAIKTTTLPNSSPAFTGDVEVHSAIVSIRQANALGSGEISVFPGGSLVLTPFANNQATSLLNLQNPLVIDGGEVRGTLNNFQPQRLVGPISVKGNASLGGLDVQGAMTLTDGSRLTVGAEFPTRLLGDLKIQGDAELRYGPPNNQVAENTTSNSLVEVRGRIVADAPQAVLRLENAGFTDFVFGASLHVPSGKSLQIVNNGQPIEINLSAGSTLTGGGIYGNPIVVEPGGVLSPGASPGTLHFASNLTVGAGAIYDWELANPLGVAGTADGWDLLLVEQALHFTATTDNPMSLRILAWPEFTPSPDPYRWLIASADSITGFEPEAISVTLGPAIASKYPHLADQITFDADGGDLFLIYQVPEPGAFCLAVSALALSIAGGFRKWNERSRRRIATLDLPASIDAR